MQKFTYRVKPGYTHGARNQYRAGDTVDLTKEEAIGFLDKLVLLSESKPYTVQTGNLTTGGLLVTPDELAKAQAALIAGATPPPAQPNAEDSGKGDEADDAPLVELDVAGATVEEVLAAVKEGKIAANAALIAEQQGKKRTSLLALLGKIVEADSKPQE